MIHSNRNQPTVLICVLLVAAGRLGPSLARALWFLEPEHYSGVGTYTEAMTRRTGYASATLGN